MSEYIETTILGSAVREFVPVSGPAPSRKLSDTDKALNRIADALERQAEATMLLARATAGEFDEPDETIDPDAARLPDGFRGMR